MIDLINFYPLNSIVLDYLFQRIIVWNNERVTEIKNVKRTNRIIKTEMLQAAPTLIKMFFEAEQKKEKGLNQMSFTEFNERTHIKINGVYTRKVIFEISAFSLVNRKILNEFLQNSDKENLQKNIKQLTAKLNELQSEVNELRRYSEILQGFKTLFNKI